MQKPELNTTRHWLWPHPCQSIWTSRRRLPLRAGRRISTARSVMAPNIFHPQWEYGNLSGELAAISDDQANELIERFREKWGRERLRQRRRA